MLFGLLADFQIDALQSMSQIAIDGYIFFLVSILNKYINSLSYGKEQFSIEHQGLQIYTNYAITIVKNESAFIKKMKDECS